MVGIVVEGATEIGMTIDEVKTAMAIEIDQIDERALLTEAERDRIAIRIIVGVDGEMATAVGATVDLVEVILL